MPPTPLLFFPPQPKQPLACGPTLDQPCFGQQRRKHFYNPSPKSDDNSNQNISPLFRNNAQQTSPILSPGGYWHSNSRQSIPLSSQRRLFFVAAFENEVCSVAMEVHRGSLSFCDTKTLSSIRAVPAGVFDVFSFIQASRSDLADLTRFSSWAGEETWAGYNEVDIGDCGGLVL